MKQNLFVLFCLTVPAFHTVSHNYYLIMTPTSWPNAQNYCRMMYTDLATIVSYSDYLQLKKETARKGLVDPAWIGLYDRADSWRWSFNEVLLMSNIFTNWYTEEPNNYIGKESCVMIMGLNGHWADKPCAGLRPFICYNADFSGSDRFIGVASPLLSWIDAQIYCRKYHTDLASSINSSDQAMLAQVSNTQGDSWIGLYRDTWAWSDGTNASNLNWYPGQPSNVWLHETCAAIFKGLFIDELCTNLRSFICHTNSPVKKQTVRVQVKSDGSLFDPATQSFVLEQMKQKLEQNSVLKNITVSWRIHPDKNIFHIKKEQNL